MWPSVDLEYPRGPLSTLDLDGWAYYNAPSLGEEGLKKGYRQSTTLASNKCHSLPLLNDPPITTPEQTNAFGARMVIPFVDQSLYDRHDSDSNSDNDRPSGARRRSKSRRRRTKSRRQHRHRPPSVISGPLPICYSAGHEGATYHALEYWQ